MSFSLVSNFMFFFKVNGVNTRNLSHEQTIALLDRPPCKGTSTHAEDDEETITIKVLKQKVLHQHHPELVPEIHTEAPSEPSSDVHAMDTRDRSMSESHPMRTDRNALSAFGTSSSSSPSPENAFHNPLNALTRPSLLNFDCSVPVSHGVRRHNQGPQHNPQSHKLVPSSVSHLSPLVPQSCEIFENLEEIP